MFQMFNSATKATKKLLDGIVPDNNKRAVSSLTSTSSPTTSLPSTSILSDSSSLSSKEADKMQVTLELNFPTLAPAALANEISLEAAKASFRRDAIRGYDVEVKKADGLSVFENIEEAEVDSIISDLELCWPDAVKLMMQCTQGEEGKHNGHASHIITPMQKLIIATGFTFGKANNDKANGENGVIQHRKMVRYDMQSETITFIEPFQSSKIVDLNCLGELGKGKVIMESIQIFNLDGTYAEEKPKLVLTLPLWLYEKVKAYYSPTLSISSVTRPSTPSSDASIAGFPDENMEAYSDPTSSPASISESSTSTEEVLAGVDFAAEIFKEAFLQATPMLSFVTPVAKSTPCEMMTSSSPSASNRDFSKKSFIGTAGEKLTEGLAHFFSRPSPSDSSVNISRDTMPSASPAPYPQP